MSLDYDLTAMVNRETHFPPNTEHVEMLGTLNRKVYSLIWGTISVQIGEITLKNADQWYDRYLAWHRLMGYPDADMPFDREDVRNAAGLRTNVYPNLTQAQWLKRTWEIFEREQQMAESRARREAEASSQAG